MLDRFTVPAFVKSIIFIKAMLVSSELETKLALKNEAVQIQVCADYNFHSEEQFKVTYWSRVLATLCSHSQHFGGISATSLKQWWNTSISQRSLPGLRKVLFMVLKDSTELITLSEIKSRYYTHFDLPNPASENKAPGQSASLVGRFAKSLWRIAVGGDNSDDDEHSYSSQMIDENELIFSIDVVRRVSKEILCRLREKAGLNGGPLESILVTESDVAASISEIMKDGKQEEPFVDLTSQHLSQITVSCLVDYWKALPFTVNNFNCLKLPPVDADAETPMSPVSERDKAYVISAIAAEKLMAQEASLTSQWTAVDNKLKEHLKAGRKPLALVALKERKILEQRLEEIQIYKLKLAESTSVTQTAVIQQAVLEAISVGNKAAQTTMAQTSPEDVEEILEQAEELRNEVKQISEAVAGSVDIDDAVLLEYEELVKKRDDEKEAKALDMIDAIPSPPTELPELPIPQSAPKTSAPQLVVPEEWFSDIKE